MTSTTSKCWIDTSILPSNFLSLQGYDFFKLINQLTSESVAELLRIQEIRNVRVFMLVPDVLAILQWNSSELDSIKSHTCFRLKENGYVVKAGIKASIRYLNELFAKKMNELYFPDSKEETEDDSPTDAANSSDSNVPIGQKRPASSILSSHQTSNKRGRK